MVSAIISALIFIVPILIFLGVQFLAQRGRRAGHWPQPKQAPTPGEPAPLKPRRRRARVRPAGEVSCGRHFTHALLTVAGARDSCRACAAIERPAPVPIADIVAEAERIANEAQD